MENFNENKVLINDLNINLFNSNEIIWNECLNLFLNGFNKNNRNLFKLKK